MSFQNSKVAAEKAFADLLRDELGETAEFSGVEFYQAQRSGEKQLPSVVVSCPSAECVEDGVPAYKADVHIAVTTSLDEAGTPTIEDNIIDLNQEERVREIEAILAEVDQVIALLRTGGFNVYGYTVVGSERITEGRSFADIVTLNVVFQPVTE